MKTESLIKFMGIDSTFAWILKWSDHEKNYYFDNSCNDGSMYPFGQSEFNRRRMG